MLLGPISTSGPKLVKTPFFSVWVIGLFPLLFCLFSVLYVCCSRKTSLKEKGCPNPSKTPGGKDTKTLKKEDGVKESPSKVTKSWSFTDRNRQKQSTRQNSEGKRMLISARTHFISTVKQAEIYYVLFAVLFWYWKNFNIQCEHPAANKWQVVVVTLHVLVHKT